MQFSTVFLAAFPLMALAAPSAPISSRQIPDPNITTAMFHWLQNTGFVSSLLDYAVSTFPNQPPNLQTNAAAALAAENDELSHKAILDNFLIYGTNAPN
ncbi:uncharacterized protein PAC_05269 [Phialocephala subalpina]|uniref:Uncharacterized protein n=1 Tax=Phialocephala subalpina TaxID=576137 RepID=A0A1L7WRH4_9HELO|nr:uncharacterized protein PAC_05269 [Phialocephala subalpina]